MTLKKERKLNRWQGYDYSFPGYYFITICTHHCQSLLGEIVDYEMKLNEIGKIVKQQLLWLHDHFPHVRLDEWVVMPNHVHLILEINYNFDDNKAGYTDDSVGTGRDGKILGLLSLCRDRSRPVPTLKSCPKILPLYRFVGAFKTRSSKLIHQIGYHDFAWQRSFHDRVIRNDHELSNKRLYYRQPC